MYKAGGVYLACFAKVKADFAASAEPPSSVYDRPSSCLVQRTNASAF